MFPTRLQDPDAPVRETDNDALLARLSAVQKGYLKDPFVHFFVPRAHLQQPRPPLINIGTWVRSESIDRLVDAWLDLCESERKQCQIISLGAGSDTRFWRLAASDRSKSIAKYVEIDFAEITTKKAMAIKKNKDLLAVLGEPNDVALTNGGTSLRSPTYNLLAADLRKPPVVFLEPALVGGTPPLVDLNMPALLLFECVLAYMQPNESSAIVSWFMDCFRGSAPIGAIVYEMFGLNDPFGRVMKNNLKTRNIELPGAEPYTSYDSLPRRFTAHGFKLAKALTLKEIRNSRLPAEDVERNLRLETLDEVEELDLVLDHYAITWGANWPDSEDNVTSKWTDWDMKWSTI
ncbi:PPM1 [Sanghuangporus sanghuang]